MSERLLGMVHYSVFEEGLRRFVGWLRSSMAARTVNPLVLAFAHPLCVAVEKRFFVMQAVLAVCERMVGDHFIGLLCADVNSARALARRQIQAGESSLVLRTYGCPQFVGVDFNAACGTFGIEHEYIPAETLKKSHTASRSTCWGEF